MTEYFSDRIIFGSLCALLVLFPVYYGGVYEGTIFLFEAAVFLLSAVHFTARVPRNEDDRSSLRIMSSVLWLCLALFTLVSVTQIVPLPSDWVGYLSPKTESLRAAIPLVKRIVPARASFATLSIAPNLSAYELIKYAAYALFTFLVYSHSGTRSRIRTIAKAMIFGGVFQASYGLFEYLSGQGKIFGWQNVHIKNAAFGTFVNRDHFAGFLEMTLSLALGYFLVIKGSFLPENKLTLRKRLLRIEHEPTQKNILLLIGIALIGLGLFASRSRSGTFILIAIFVMVALFTFWGSDASASSKRRLRRSLGFIMALVVITAIALITIGGQSTLERLTSKSLKSTGRLDYAKTTLEIAKDFQATGTGLGTFAEVYPMYERITDGAVLEHAHNDYLETLAESGWLGGTALIILAFAALCILIRKWRRRQDPLAKGIGIGSAAGIMALLIHGLTDFNLRIPANTVYFLTLYALGFNAVITRRKDRESEPRNQESSSPSSRKRAGRGLIGATLIALFLLSASHYAGYYFFARYEKTWNGTKSLERDFSAMEADLKKAITFSKNPHFYGALGRLYLEKAVLETRSKSAEGRDLLCDQAEKALLEQIRRNPAEAYGFYRLGLVLRLYNYPLLTYRDKARIHLERAITLKPADDYMGADALAIIITQWDELNPVETKLVVDQFKRERYNSVSFLKNIQKRVAGYGGSDAPFKSALQSDPALWDKYRNDFQ